MILRTREKSASDRFAFRIYPKDFQSPSDIVVCHFSGNGQKLTWAFTKNQWFGLKSSGVIPLEELRIRQSRHLYSRTKDKYTIQQEEELIRQFLSNL